MKMRVISRDKDKKLYDKNILTLRHVNVFVVDEVGALPNRSAIDSMESGQLNMKNRTGILISTAYPSLKNPMIEEVQYAKRVLDGSEDNPRLFSLLYEPDNTEDWLSDQTLLQANPLCYEVEENLKKLQDDRKVALSLGGEKKSTFLTKHLNIFIDDDLSNTYIPTKDVVKCRLVDENFNWYGQRVYIGVDLSQSNDNTSVAMVTYDEHTGEYVAKVWAFLPSFNIKEKKAKERIDYVREQENGLCFIVGENIIDYGFIEDFVIGLPDKYGVNILAIGYDRYNAMSSTQKWESHGFDTVEVRQHSSTLHPATKLLKEEILNQNFKYESNRILEANFGNARVTYDTNKNIYVNKKKSSGKVDMVVALINAMFLWNLEQIEGQSTYEDRGIIVL